MSTLPASGTLAAGTSGAAVALGLTGMVLFFLPILGIPISALGLVLGLVSWVRCQRPEARRWLRLSMTGAGASLAALILNIAIASDPTARLSDRSVPGPGREDAPSTDVYPRTKP